MASMDGLVPITRAFLASYCDKYPFTPLSDDVSRLTTEIRSMASDLCKDFPLIEEEPKKKITKKNRGTKKKGWFSSMFQSSCWLESQRQATSLLGQFAAIETLHIVQKGVVQQLIEMLQSHKHQ
ncbi:hypothetical protein CsSME_00043187 [Camellia sinensis var. sinensis]